MPLIDKILLVLFILIITSLTVYFIYFIGNEESLNVFTAILGATGFLLGLFEFFRKKD